MKVFVSWSKDSRGVGKAVSDAVREIFDPVVETFISQEILAGSRGLDIIDDELNGTDFGIICLTRANQTEQWINYEAGALSRQVENKRSRMGVFLVDLPGAEDVNSPLDIFQCKVATLEGFSELMVSLNELEPKLKESTLQKRIDAAWPDVERAVNEVGRGRKVSLTKPTKSADEKLDEMLRLVKAVEGSFGDVLAVARQNLENTEVLAGLLDRREGRLRPIKSTWHSSITGSQDNAASMAKPAHEVNDLLEDTLREISSLPYMVGVEVNLSNSRIRFRLKRPISPTEKKFVISTLSPFYAPSEIGFTVADADRESDGMKLL